MSVFSKAWSQDDLIGQVLKEYVTPAIVADVKRWSEEVSPWWTKDLEDEEEPLYAIEDDPYIFNWR